MPDITVFGSTVELLLNASSNRAAREGGIVSGRKRRPYTSARKARGSCDRTKRKAQARVGCTLAVREGSSPAMRAVVVGARICQHTNEGDALLGGA